MKRTSLALVIIALGLAAGSPATAAHHEASVENGKALFNDPKLGTTGRSCNDCHENGKGIEKAAGRKDLDSVVNGCITQALKGKALDVKSPDMQSLIIYINSLGVQKKEKKAAVGC